MRDVSDELRDLLTKETRPVGPFEGVLSRARRRRRRQVLASVSVAVAIVTLGFVSLHSSSSPTVLSPIANGPTPSAPEATQDPRLVDPAGVLDTCRPGDLKLTLTWRKRMGELSGELLATNPTKTPCALLLKPFVQPLDEQGVPLATQFFKTDEGKFGPRALLPGRSATSRVLWSGWCGPPAGHRVQISWANMTVDVMTSGPVQPSCPSGPKATTNLSSTWFDGLASDPE